MLTLPTTIVAALTAFAACFSPRVWRHAQVLLAGAILAPAHRTVTATLRVMGLARTAQFHRYHRVLSRARWSGLALSRALLQQLVTTFAPHGPLLLGIDETVERRRGHFCSGGPLMTWRTSIGMLKGTPPGPGAADASAAS